MIKEDKITIKKVGRTALHELIAEVLEKASEGYVLASGDSVDTIARRFGRFTYQAIMFKTEKVEKTSDQLLEEVNTLTKKAALIAFAEAIECDLGDTKSLVPAGIKKILKDFINKESEPTEPSPLQTQDPLNGEIDKTEKEEEPTDQESQEASSEEGPGSEEVEEEK